MIQNFTRRHGNQLCTSGNLGDKIYIEHVADYVSMLRHFLMTSATAVTIEVVKHSLVTAAARVRGMWHRIQGRWFSPGSPISSTT